MRAHGDGIHSVAYFGEDVFRLFPCSGVLKSPKFLQERMACLEWAKGADVGQRILLEVRSKLGRKIYYIRGTTSFSSTWAFLPTQLHGRLCCGSCPTLIPPADVN